MSLMATDQRKLLGQLSSEMHLVCQTPVYIYKSPQSPKYTNCAWKQKQFHRKVRLEGSTGGPQDPAQTGAQEEKEDFSFRSAEQSPLHATSHPVQNETLAQRLEMWLSQKIGLPLEHHVPTSWEEEAGMMVSS